MKFQVFTGRSLKSTIDTMTVLVEKLKFSKASLAQSSYLEVTKALPEEFRPTLQINLPLAADSAGMWLRVNTSGIAQVRNRTGSSIGTSYYMRIDAMYPV